MCNINATINPICLILLHVSFVCHIKSLNYLYSSSVLVACDPYAPRERPHHSAVVPETIQKEIKILREQ